MCPRSPNLRFFRPGLTPRFPRRVWVFLLAGCASLFPSIARTQTPQTTPALDIASYESELQRCADSLNSTANIHRLRQSLPRSWQVRVGDHTVSVATDWLASDLRKMDEDAANSSAVSRNVASRLTAMRKSAAALESGASAAIFDAAHSRLDKILQGRDFGSVRGPSRLDILKARMVRWINEQIFKLLMRLHLGATAGNAVAWVIIGIAFLALCFWVWQTLKRAEQQREPVAAGAVEWNDQGHWAMDALAAAERGDYREAVHCAYWAGVVHLETIGVLKRDRARTPRESLRSLDPHPREQNLLREFTRHFELIWYGYRPASAQDWSEARTHLEKMGCLAPSTPATAGS